MSYSARPHVYSTCTTRVIHVLSRHPSFGSTSQCSPQPPRASRCDAAMANLTQTRKHRHPARRERTKADFVFSTLLTTGLTTGEGRSADTRRGERETDVPFVSVDIKCTRVFDSLQDACLTLPYQNAWGTCVRGLRAYRERRSVELADTANLASSRMTPKKCDARIARMCQRWGPLLRERGGVKLNLQFPQHPLGRAVIRGATVVPCGRASLRTGCHSCCDTPMPDSGTRIRLDSAQ